MPSTTHICVPWVGHSADSRQASPAFRRAPRIAIGVDWHAKPAAVMLTSRHGRGEFDGSDAPPAAVQPASRRRAAPRGGLAAPVPRRRAKCDLVVRHHDLLPGHMPVITARPARHRSRRMRSRVPRTVERLAIGGRSRAGGDTAFTASTAGGQPIDQRTTLRPSRVASGGGNTGASAPTTQISRPIRRAPRFRGARCGWRSCDGSGRGRAHLYWECAFLKRPQAKSRETGAGGRVPALNGSLLTTLVGACRGPTPDPRNAKESGVPGEAEGARNAYVCAGRLTDVAKKPARGRVRCHQRRRDVQTELSDYPM